MITPESFEAANAYINNTVSQEYPGPADYLLDRFGITKDALAALIEVSSSINLITSFTETLVGAITLALTAFDLDNPAITAGDTDMSAFENNLDLPEIGGEN